MIIIIIIVIIREIFIQGKPSGGWWDFFLGGANFQILGVVKTNFGSHTPKAFIT